MDAVKTGIFIREQRKKMGLSHMTARREFLRIKNIILDEYYGKIQ